MHNIDSIQNISAIGNDELANVTGGNAFTKLLKKGAKFAGKRVLGPVGWAWTGYDAVDGYLDSREKGKGVLESVKDGAINAAF